MIYYTNPHVSMDWFRGTSTEFTENHRFSHERWDLPTHQKQRFLRRKAWRKRRTPWRKRLIGWKLLRNDARWSWEMVTGDRETSNCYENWWNMVGLSR